MLHKQESKSKGEERVKGKTHLDLETLAASALSRAEFPAPQQLRNFAQHIGFAACRTNSQILLSNFMEPIPLTLAIFCSSICGVDNVV